MQIPETVYKQILKQPLSGKVIEEVKKDINLLSADEIAIRIEEVDITKLNYNLAKKVVKSLGVKPKSQKKADIFAALSSARFERIKFVVPINVKRSIKLRDEFPFLKQKNCPGILKELVADMLTAYDNYTEAHPLLINTSDKKELEALSKEVVENYLENRQIWEELNHYKKTGKILGKHPIFEWVTRRGEIRGMKEAELVKLRDQLKNKIPRTKKTIADNPDHKDTAKRQQRVEQFEKELAEVNSLLGISE